MATNIPEEEQMPAGGGSECASWHLGNTDLVDALTQDKKKPLWQT